MHLGTSHELYAYWNCLRRARPAPERTEIDPAAIRNVLADTFILELEEDACFRVAGARISAIFGRELKSDLFLSLWRREDRDEIAALLAASAADLRPAAASAVARPRGRVQVEMEILLLPLLHYGRPGARMLGALAPASIPTWLGLFAAEPMSLVDSRALDPAAELGSESPEASAHRPAMRRRHLFVHEGGRELV